MYIYIYIYIGGSESIYEPYINCAYYIRKRAIINCSVVYMYIATIIYIYICH